MPLNLDHFLDVAANRTTSEIYLSGPDHSARAQTRGSLRSWLVSIFKGNQTRNQRAETTHVFVAALQEKVSLKLSGLQGARQEVREQYNEDADHIVQTLKGLLANQLNGQRALTADDIRRATEFIDSTLSLADNEKDEYAASLNREESIQLLETKARSFFGRNRIEDIHVSDAEAAARDAAITAAQELTMAERGIRVVSRAAPPPAPPTLVSYLRGYMQGTPPNMTHEEKLALTRSIRDDLREIRRITSTAIPLFETLSNGRTDEEAALGNVPAPLHANQWTAGIESGSDEAKSYLAAYKNLAECLGPMQALEYFLCADLAEEKREEFLDAKTHPLNSGGSITGERSVREMLDDFLDGKTLAEAEVAFLGSVRQSRILNQADQLRPGFRLAPSMSNPASNMSPVIRAVNSTPNDIWEVVANGLASNPRQTWRQ